MRVSLAARCLLVAVVAMSAAEAGGVLAENREMRRTENVGHACNIDGEAKTPFFVEWTPTDDFSEDASYVMVVDDQASFFYVYVMLQ